MEDKYIVYRNPSKIKLLLIVNSCFFIYCIITVINPYILNSFNRGRFTPESMRFLCVCAGITFLIEILLKIKMLKKHGEYLYLDSKGISEDGEEKILWKDILWMKEKAKSYGWSLEFGYKYKIDSGEYIEHHRQISFLEVAGNREQIRRTIKEYWKKYR